MATAPVLLSIEEYLRTSYKPDVDFVDGELQERHVGEQQHSILQTYLSFLFLSRQSEWKLEPLSEQRIRISSSRARVCDMAVTAVDARWADVLQEPPIICIEILSPEDRMSRAERVLADYFAFGVPNIWLIDPMRRAAYTYGANGLAFADPTNLNIPGTEVSVDLTPAFERIDSKRRV